MFHLLTKYLLQFKSVVIPHVGRIELTRHPAELDFAHRLLHAPAYSLRMSEDDEVTNHQVGYIAQALGEDMSAAQMRLAEFGAALKTKLGDEEVTWNGIGVLGWRNDAVVFNPEAIDIEAWKAVPIHKVLRGEEPHPVLMGDREMQSLDARELLGKDGEVPQLPVQRKTMWIGWIAAALASLFIGYYLYSHHFLPYASGNTTRIVPAPQPATYH